MVSTEYRMPTIHAVAVIMLKYKVKPLYQIPWFADKNMNYLMIDVLYTACSKS